MGSQVTFDGVDNDTLHSIERAIGSAYNDTIYGTGGADLLDGGTGGADTFYGGDGGDRVSYANSKTGVYIDLSSKLTWDGTDHDTLNSIEGVVGSSFDDVVFVAPDSTAGLDGGRGYDTLSFSSLGSGIVLNIAAGTATRAGSGHHFSQASPTSRAMSVRNSPTPSSAAPAPSAWTAAAVTMC